ncbi:MAG TPA: hypothetical protein VF221_22980, partial [Chloroflexota bacterium]
AGLYRAVTGFLADSFDRVLDPCSSEHAAVGRGPVVRARDRAGEAFGEYLAERGTKSVDPKTAAFLVAAGTFAITGGDLLNVIADLGFQVRDGADGMTALRGQTQIVLASFLRLADRLDDTRSALLGGAGVSDGALRDAALASLRRWRDNPEEGQSAVAVIVAAEWVQQLGELATDLEATVDRAVEEARVPWWR